MRGLLRGLSITVMDGPFFSVMPYPARGLPQSFARPLHVTGHARRRTNFTASRPITGRVLRANEGVTSSATFRPMAAAEHLDSLYEIKTVLLTARPTTSRPSCSSDTRAAELLQVLGGKLDNIDDVLKRLAEVLVGPADVPRRFRQG